MAHLSAPALWLLRWAFSGLTLLRLASAAAPIIALFQSVDYVVTAAANFTAQRKADRCLCRSVHHTKWGCVTTLLLDNGYIPAPSSAAPTPSRQATFHYCCSFLPAAHRFYNLPTTTFFTTNTNTHVLPISSSSTLSCLLLGTQIV